MTANELKRWLRKRGCTFTEGAEIKTGTCNVILKKLGLKK